MRVNHFSNFIVLVTGILRNKKGEVLLIKRSRRNKTFRGFWQLPEGKMEFGEQPVETLERELKEELGCRLDSAQPVTASSTVVSFRGISYHVLRVVLETQWEGEITLNSEHEDYQWVGINEALKIPKLVDGTREILSNLK